MLEINFDTFLALQVKYFIDDDVIFGEFEGFFDYNFVLDLNSGERFLVDCNDSSNNHYLPSVNPEEITNKIQFLYNKE